MIKFSVTRNGIPLDSQLYIWDESTRTFSTNEDCLVLDFKGVNRVTFNTGSNCTFTTGFGCIFNTGSNCTFTTGFSCIFNTGYHCIFTTKSHCKFITGHSCIFTTLSYCTFTTGSSCTFKTGNNCVIIRSDILEIIKLEEDFNYIILNRFRMGYQEKVNKELNDFYFTKEDFKIK